MAEWIGLLCFFLFIGIVLYYGHRKSDYSWSFDVVYEYAPQLARGLGLTLILTALIIVTGSITGLSAAALRMSRFPLARALVTAYIEVMRSTPLLVILIWSYYVLPILTGINLTGWFTGIFALTLHTGAIYAEAFRAGIQSVPVDQKEAAYTLGLSGLQQFRFVVFPQAVRNVIPVLVTCMLTTLKETTLVTLIGISDLMNVGTRIALDTYRPLEILTVVGLIYISVGLPLSLVARWMEIRLQQRHQRGAPSTSEEGAEGA